MAANVALSVVIVAFFVFVIIYKRRTLEKLFSLDSSRTIEGFRQELERTGDELIARLEERIQHLEYVIAEADVRIEELEKRLGERAEEGLTPSDQQAEKTGITDWQPLSFEARATSPVKAEEIPPRQEIAEEQAKNAKGMKEERRAIIIAMAQQGHSITEIAKATGAGRGEIMLLLQLHRQ